MVFENSEAATEFVKSHAVKIPEWILTARKKEEELSALIEGKGFKKELINNIEHLESKKKAIAREKYSRSIVDLYERLLLPISNVFSATGGKKSYIIDNPEQAKTFLKTISKIRDGKSIESYVEDVWMQLYHTDPNGVLFMEYVTEPATKVWPTYKSIHNIRTYVPNGQLVEVILFEPVEESKDVKIWRLVDDNKDYRIQQSGEIFTVIEDKTFTHPFSESPALINSDIVDIKEKIRLSPINKIVEISREYARDQSIKTIYKFLHGFPLFWKYITQCKKCTGSGKTGDKVCVECDGYGFYKSKDVTDAITLSPPTKDQVVLDPIAGFITPDLEVWDQYTKEIDILEIKMQDTHWGTHQQRSGNETATGRFIDIQPIENRLTKYSKVAQFVEKQITEWVADVVVDGKEKGQNVSFIFYGTGYIMETPEKLLERYSKAKADSLNNVILDRMFTEYLTSKYKNDPEWLGLELKKSEVEPYLHLALEDITKAFGVEEAQKKVFFQKWWTKNLPDIKSKQLNVESLSKSLDTDYKSITINQI
ncbi:MAG: hypothetical protein ACUZ8H_16025 [Candidatus Anammoxibacter sp.]